MTDCITTGISLAYTVYHIYQGLAYMCDFFADLAEWSDTAVYVPDTGVRVPALQAIHVVKFVTLPPVNGFLL